MKLKLLFLLLIVTCIGYAQAPINNFFSASTTMYALDISNPAIDQSADGANLVWNFSTNLNTSAIDSHGAPSPGDINTYPGSTLKIKTVITGADDLENFIKEDGSNVSITGYYSTDFELTYDTDNALLGSYPSNYGDSTTDDFSGTYSYSGLSGTFTGTIESSVDAYGTLTTNDVGQGGFNGNVTRIKSVQNANLYSSLVPGVAAEATLTSYKYFDDTNGNLVFRSNNVKIVSDYITDVNTITYESMLSSPLGINDTELASNSIKIFPNPVSDILNVYTYNNQVIKSISITDINGKVVLKSQDKKAFLSVNHLQSGLYFANISTENNYFTLKFIKK